jgi:hypothetical protein
MRRWQDCRAISGKDIGDPLCLGDGAQCDLQRARAKQHITAAHCFAQHPELSANGFIGKLLQLLFRWKDRLARNGSPGHLLQVWSDGNTFQPVRLDPLLEIGGYT